MDVERDVVIAMDDRERLEILHNAAATIERADATLEACPVTHQHADRPPPEPEWWRHETTLTMSRREFGAWCDAGQPSLAPRKAEPVQLHGPGITTAQLNCRMEQFAEQLGGLVAETQRALAARLRAELQALKDEVAALRVETGIRQELDGLHRSIEALRSDRVLDLQAEPQRRAATGPRRP